MVGTFTTGRTDADLVRRYVAGDQHALADIYERYADAVHDLCRETLPSPEEAIHAYTVGSAMAEGKEDQKGVLAPGMLADFVLLRRDPFSIDPEVFPNFEVTHTVVGGKVVYRAP